jgi:hypothetical protein
MNKNLLIFIAFLCSILSAKAQNPSLISGKVINGFTKEPIAFCTVRWIQQKNGTICDSLGVFSIPSSKFSNDSLIINYVGFDAKKYAFKDLKMGQIVLTLESVSFKEEVVVKSKFNKGLRWWKFVVNNKASNNPYNYPNYGCELYNKLELDLNNVNKNSFSNINFLKPFSFILDNIDSVSEAKPFLPVLMTESLSDFYSAANPKNTREIVKASQTHGIKSESIMQLIGGVNQKINIYDNYIKFFGKEFISPISEFAEKFYKFRGADTQYIKGIKVYHLLFSPLNEGENTFSGDAWIDANTWAIHKINLNISPTADINFVNRLNIVQEFEKLENGKLIFSKDRITADLSPLPKDKLTFIVRKTISYKDFTFDIDSVSKMIALNKKANETFIKEDIFDKKATYWNNARHEMLNKNEQHVFKMIDTLKSIPLFREYTRNLEFLVDGHRKLGKIEIGPWYKWISGNQLEQVRLRFDIGTTELFSKNLRLSGYLAYGTKDQALKKRIAVEYKFPHLNGISAELSYLKDLDNGRVRFNEEDMTIDNIFSQTLRRTGIPQKFLGEEEIKLKVNKEWASGLSNSFTFSRVGFDPYTPLPSRSTFKDGRNLEIINSDIMYRIRYAPGEKKILTNRKAIRFKGNQPIYELRVSEGIDGLMGSSYTYTKLHAAVSQKVRIPNFGVITYNAYAGKIYGDSLPFMLLELHPGNEVYMYNKNGFNLMNRFEYYSDTYAGFQVEHNIEKKLINYIPLLRKTKIRQFWTLKGVWGHMNPSNRIFNKTELGPYQLRSLRDHTYLEYGTGFDNIFRFFRIDFVWRSAPPYPANFAPSRMQPVQNFGIFGSLRLQF